MDEIGCNRPEHTDESESTGNDILTPLEDGEIRDAVTIFKLLADETRVKVLDSLIHEGEIHVTALCDKLGQSQPAVSHHLSLLRVGGLIEARREGKHNFYSIALKFSSRIASVSKLISKLNTPDQ